MCDGAGAMAFATRVARERQYFYVATRAMGLWGGLSMAAAAGGSLPQEGTRALCFGHAPCLLALLRRDGLGEHLGRVREGGCIVARFEVLDPGPKVLYTKASFSSTLSTAENVLGSEGDEEGGNVKVTPGASVTEFLGDAWDILQYF